MNKIIKLLTKPKYPVSDLLNNHFTSVGPNMDAKIPSTTRFFGFSSLPNSFVFDPIMEDEVYSQILQLNSKKSAGPKNILIKFFRILASIISSYLKDAYVLCYETGTFPNCLKNAKVIPIYKIKQKDKPTNYGPISLLSPISKLFEKLLHHRLENFFSKNSVISKQQFGFRCGYFTEMAVINLHKKLVRNKDEGYVSCCLF